MAFNTIVVFALFFPTSLRHRRMRKKRKRRIGEEGKGKGGRSNQGRTEEGVKMEMERKMRFKEKEDRNLIMANSDL